MNYRQEVNPHLEWYDMIQYPKTNKLTTNKDFPSIKTELIDPFLSPALPAEPMTEKWVDVTLPGGHLKGKADKNDWSKGVKFDQNKPRMDLLDPEFLEHVAQVLTFGAQKYAAHNWRNGIDYSRLIAASYRHLGAINRGEDIDPESGLPHSAHLGCCVMFLDWMLANRPELDDRWKSSETEKK